MRRDPVRTGLPLVLTGARMESENHGPFGKDVQVGEDPLPAIVETTGSGRVLARHSRNTKVGGETTDDR